MYFFITTVFATIIMLASSFAVAGEIKYVGSSTIGQFMNEAAKVYTQSTFSINTEPESNGGVNATVAGRTDLGGVACDLKPEVLKKGVNAYNIGKDGIGVLVHPSNPVSELSKQQLAGIFSGVITNWKEVGGHDTAIDVYIASPKSATRKVFLELILKAMNYGGARTRTVRPDQNILEKVQGNPGGIGQLSFSFLRNAQVKLIKPDGEQATVNNVDYPILRNLNLATKGVPQGEVKRFIDWALSAKGQEIVKIHFAGIETIEK